MKTLQEKYNGINEGKFTKDQFLRDARMEQPSLVTQYNGYDDAVQILKNRGMIAEARVAYDVPMIDNQRAAFDRLSDLYFEYLRKYAKSKGDDTSISNSQLADKYREEIETKLGLPPHSAYAVIAKELKNKGMIQENDPGSIYYIAKSAASGKYIVNKASKHASQTVTGNQKFKTEAEAQAEADKKNKETVKEARLTNKSLTDYRYKPTNDMDKYPYEQILRGLRVELEGLNVISTPTPEEYTKALGKVLKNLEKDSIFYTNQVAGVKANAKRTDLMVDATPKNEVDKENGLKKAALKEAIKGVIKNILSESPDPDLYDQDEERDERRFTHNDQGDFGPESDFGDYYPEPDEEVYEMYGEDDIDYDDENFSDPLIDGEEEDDIPHPRGYEEASDEEDFEDLFKENKSEKEVRAEWEKYQATCHPEDRMSYMEWRSEHGLDEDIFESVSLKDLLD